MRNQLSRLIIAVAGILLVSLGISCCDDDNPVKPPAAKDYYIYFANELAPNTYYRYSTGTMELDSFNLPYNSVFDGFGISPDGKTMYFHPDEGIVEIELDSFTVVAEHPLTLKKELPRKIGHEVHISPDGRYLALLDPYLDIVRLSDYSVVYTDTVNRACFGWFSDDSRKLLCSLTDISDNLGHVYVLEVNLGDSVFTIAHDISPGSPAHIVADPEYREWYMLSYLGTGVYRFYVYDFLQDSVVFSRDMFSDGGDLVITPDGKHIFYSYCRPEMTIPGSTPQDIVTCFDIVSNEIDRDILTYVDSLEMVVSVGGMSITPDGRNLIGISTEKGQIFHYDLTKDRVIKRLQFGAGMTLFSPVCQRKP